MWWGVSTCGVRHWRDRATCRDAERHASALSPGSRGPAEPICAVCVHRPHLCSQHHSGSLTAAAGTSAHGGWWLYGLYVDATWRARAMGSEFSCFAWSAHFIFRSVFTSRFLRSHHSRPRSSTPLAFEYTYCTHDAKTRVIQAATHKRCMRMCILDLVRLRALHARAPPHVWVALGLCR